MERTHDIILQPIGQVQNDLKNGRGRKLWQGTTSKIVLNEEFIDALYGIEEYSHVVVVFWMDRITVEERSKIRILVPYAPEYVGFRGVLATRVPERPNPVGISLVPLVSRSKNILTVKELDALDGTPVIDIKPYTGHSLERIENFSVPEWERIFS